MKQERIVELWLKSGDKLEVKRNCQRIEPVRCEEEKGEEQ